MLVWGLYYKQFAEIKVKVLVLVMVLQIKYAFPRNEKINVDT